MIIDDDISVVKMLSNLINKNGLGKVVEELTDAEHAVDEILFYNPDILLIDYLLPTTDGIDIIKTIIERGFTGKVIMISQVENQSMIANAYNSGVLFFINKPINSIEVINVIKTVSHNIELENSLYLIKSALSNVNKTDNSIELDTSIIEKILTDLGIISDSGSQDLIRIIKTINDHIKNHERYQYSLKDIYKEVLKKENPNKSISEKDIKSLEQRIRRIIQKALSNIAEIGLEDFYNPMFSEYAALLFDIKYIKQEMQYLKNPSEDRGKINIKKFINGILTRL
jgi:two-component system response regulator YcbB